MLGGEMVSTLLHRHIHQQLQFSHTQLLVRPGIPTQCTSTRNHAVLKGRPVVVAALVEVAEHEKHWISASNNVDKAVDWVNSTVIDPMVEIDPVTVFRLILVEKQPYTMQQLQPWQPPTPLPIMWSMKSRDVVAMIASILIVMTGLLQLWRSGIKLNRKPMFSSGMIEVESGEHSPMAQVGKQLVQCQQGLHEVAFNKRVRNNVADRVARVSKVGSVGQFVVEPEIQQDVAVDQQDEEVCAEKVDFWAVQSFDEKNGEESKVQLTSHTNNFSNHHTSINAMHMKPFTDDSQALFVKEQLSTIVSGANTSRDFARNVGSSIKSKGVLPVCVNGASHHVVRTHCSYQWNSMFRNKEEEVNDRELDCTAGEDELTELDENAEEIAGASASIKAGQRMNNTFQKQAQTSKDEAAVCAPMKHPISANGAMNNVETGFYIPPFNLMPRNMENKVVFVNEQELDYTTGEEELKDIEKSVSEIAGETYATKAGEELNSTSNEQQGASKDMHAIVESPVCINGTLNHVVSGFRNPELNPIPGSMGEEVSFISDKKCNNMMAGEDLTDTDINMKDISGAACSKKIDEELKGAFYTTEDIISPYATLELAAGVNDHVVSALQTCQCDSTSQNMAEKPVYIHDQELNYMMGGEDLTNTNGNVDEIIGEPYSPETGEQLNEDTICEAMELSVSTNSASNHVAIAIQPPHFNAFSSNMPVEFDLISDQGLNYMTKGEHLMNMDETVDEFPGAVFLRKSGAVLNSTSHEESDSPKDVVASCAAMDLPLDLQGAPNDVAENITSYKVLETALTAVTVWVGMVLGVSGALQLVGLISLLTFIAHEMLWAKSRELLWQEVSGITDRQELLEFLFKRNIVKKR